MLYLSKATHFFLTFSLCRSSETDRSTRPLSLGCCLVESMIRIIRVGASTGFDSHSLADGTPYGAAALMFCMCYVGKISRFLVDDCAMQIGK